MLRSRCVSNAGLQTERSESALLTDVGGPFGDGEVGAHAPGSSVVMLLAAAAVRPRGVVLALTSQPAFVEHAAVGMQVALAPETKTQGQRPT